MPSISEEFKLNFNFGGNAEFLSRLETLMERVDKKVESVEGSARDAADATDEMADSVKNAEKAFDGINNKLSLFGDRLKSIVGYYVSFQAASSGISKVWSMGLEGMNAFSTQERAENQLKGVLKNRGSLDQFQSIKDYAAEIQRRSIYGDEAMLKGAGELATYVEGTGSLKSMMDLLTDYAAGMTGGGEVSPEQMESLATGLGMAYDGNYMAMRRKGFDTSKLQALDALAENGGRWNEKLMKKYGSDWDDEQKNGFMEIVKQAKAAGGITEQMRVDALRESLEDWKGLSDSVNDLSSSAIVKFNNRLGDLREKLGEKVYPVFNKLVKLIDDRMPVIEDLFKNVGEIFEDVVKMISDNIDDIASFAKSLMSLLSTFAKGAFYTITWTNKILGFKEAIIGLVGAMAVGKVMEFVKAMRIVKATMAGAEGASAVGGLAGAFNKLGAAMNTTAGKIALVGGALWGLQKIAEYIPVMMDWVESYFNSTVGRMVGAMGDKKGEEESELKKKLIEADKILENYRQNHPDYKNDEKYQNALAARNTIEKAIQGKKNARKAAAAIANNWFARNQDISHGENPMDDYMANAKATQAEIEGILKDSKGDTHIHNKYENTNIEQNVSVAADMQKIGILLNQNIRAIIEKQLRQNREVSLGQA